MEAKVARAIDTERLSGAAVDGMRAGITETIDDLLEADRQAKAQLRKQLSKLEAQEERLIELAADGTMGVPKLRTRLEKTVLEKAAAAERLELTTERLRYGAEKASAYIELLREPGTLYRNAPDPARRDLLGALFACLLVHVDARAKPAQGNGTRDGARERDCRAQFCWQYDKSPSHRSDGLET